MKKFLSLFLTLKTKIKRESTFSLFLYLTKQKIFTKDFPTQNFQILKRKS